MTSLRPFITRSGDTRSGDKETAVAVQSDGDGQYTIEINGKTSTVSLCPVHDERWCLLMDHRTYETSVKVLNENPNEPVYRVELNRQAIDIIVQDAHLATAQDQVGSHTSELRTVSAPMPGKVVKILARVGDIVKKDQPLLVVEAMKMENEVCATRDGEVRSIEVSEGQTIEADTELIQLK